MKELQFLINDVRAQTDNEDTNGIKDREIVRYFNDGIKNIQTIIFKNNPLCSYYQEPVIYEPIADGRTYTLPSDCYGDNAVSLVEMESEGSWYPIERVWPEEGQAFFGYFTRNKTLILSGRENQTISQRIRVHYFKRLPRFDKVWATVSLVAGGVLTIENNDTDMFKIDRFISLFTNLGVLRRAGLSYVKTDDTHLTITGSLTDVAVGDVVVMGPTSLLTVDIPEECEPYLMDYVAQRIAGRNTYTEDWNKLNYWNSEERSNIISIFADASQAQTRAPITDTEYMRI